MKAVAVRATGDAGVLQVEEAERPEPDEGELLIQVKAAAVNPVDWKYRRGLVERELPTVLGEDVSGTVEASRTGGFSPGDGCSRDHDERRQASPDTRGKIVLRVDA